MGRKLNMQRSGTNKTGKKKAPQVSGNKAQIGLNDEMLNDLKSDPDLEEMLKLHNYVQKIKKRHFEVKQQVGELRTMYEDLGTRMQDVAKAQSTNYKTGGGAEKKEDDG